MFNENAKIVKESTIPTEPKEIASYIKSLKIDIGLVGLESGSLSHWLTEELVSTGLPVKCIDARHYAAFCLNTLFSDKIAHTLKDV